MDLKKQLILIASPPACGKTRLSRRVATELYGAVYLDKDSLIPLSKRIFKVARKPYNRSSAFFKREIRDYEYEAILSVAFEAIKYNDRVILNAPFTTEIRNEEYITDLKKRFETVGAELVIVWIMSDRNACYRNMKHRNSDRDKWKLEHWDEYIESVNFAAPEFSTFQPFIYDVRNQSEIERSFKNLIEYLKGNR